MRRWWRVWILAGLALGVVLGTLLPGAVAQRTCGAEFSDAASSALRAEVVLEGKVKTLHKTGEKSAFYNVTVQVRKVLKGGDLLNGGKKPKRLTVGIFGPDDPVQCVTQVNMGKTYFFFLKRPEGKVLEIMALPEVRDKKTSRTVRKILCRNCAKVPKLRGKFKPQEVELGKKVKVRCRARGKPDVVYEWLKDGNPLPRKKTVKVRKNKRGSTLEIRRAALDDSGTYKCVARNQVGSDTGEFQITVFKPGGMQYPACEQQTLCFNGGTCRHISALNMPVCECPQEWSGQRCEVRDIFSQIRANTQKAALVTERTYIIVGIVIALVVFIIICIASYFLARRQRKKFEARRQKKNIPEHKPLLDEVDARGGPPPPNLRGLMRNQETQTEELIGNHVTPYPRDVVVPVDENVEAVLRPKSNLEVNGHEPRPLSARSRLKAESQDESPPEKVRQFDLPNGLEPATLATRPEHIELQILNTRAPLQGLSPSTPRSPSDLAQPVVSGGCDAEEISPPDDSLLATWAHSPGVTPVGSTPGITPGGTPKNTPEEESGSGSPGFEGLPPYLINGPLPPPAPALYDSSSEEEGGSGQLTPLHISEDDLRLSEAELRRLSSLSNDHSAVMSGQGGPWSSASTPASQSSPSKLGLGADSGYQPSYPSQTGRGGSGGPGGSLGSDRTPPDLGSPSEGSSSSDSAVRSEPDLCWDEHGSSVASRHPYQPFPPGQDDLEDKVTYSAPEPQPFPRSASLQERLRDVREDQDPIPV